MALKMNALNRTTVVHSAALAAVARRIAPRPERIVQFGEGNFLRAFADWMIDELNEKNLFEGDVVVVQPIRRGLAAAINAQEGLYTLIARGVEEGKVVESRRVITSVRRALDPYTQWADMVALFQSPDLRFAISNTTEAGIAYVAEPFVHGVCPESFPAKVTALLHARFVAFQGNPGRGLIFLPCELIDRNGDNLLKTVLQHADAWNLPKAFVLWVKEANHFLNTLVDRIVPGYPHAEASRIEGELGYSDQLLVAAEHFHLWVIEGPQNLARELPFAQAGLNVVWTDDLAPYRTRKVRVLNGAHSASSLAAHAAGVDTVRDMMDDPVLGAFVRRLVFDEILPLVALPEAEKQAYAASVLERFRNPFVRHELMSISLNSVSKWKVRVLPSLLDAHAVTGELPRLLSFSLAALIWFYRAEQAKDGTYQGHRRGKVYPIRDDAPVLEFFASAWAEARVSRNWTALTSEVLGRADFWGRDLNEVPGLTECVAADLRRIRMRGMKRAVAAALADPTESREFATDHAS